MGVTQYIGSRYVPVFADPAEWNNTRTYEPLTIVLHKGNSYTSRQYTPAGIDIANEAFWIETGNYNAQIELYRQETKAIANNMKLSFVTPEMFGAKGDGISDDKQAITDAIKYANTTTVIFSNKTYAVSEAIELQNINNKVLLFNAATIKGTKSSKMGSGVLFALYASNNVDIIGGTFIVSDLTGDTNCLGCGGDCSNIRFLNNTCKDSHRKAIAPQSGYSNVVIDGLTSVNCRSGIEIGKGTNAIVRNCNISTDGSTNDVTTSDPAPIFGLNIESSNNVVVELTNVSGFETGVTLSTSVLKIVEIRNCIIDGLTSIKGLCKIHNCIINGQVDMYLFTDGETIIDECELNSPSITISSENGTFSFVNSKLNITSNSNAIQSNRPVYISGCSISGTGTTMLRLLNSSNASLIGNTINGFAEVVRMSAATKCNLNVCNNLITGSTTGYALYGSSICSSFSNIFENGVHYASDGNEPSIYADLVNGSIKTKLS